MNVEYISVTSNITEILSHAFMPLKRKQSKFNEIILSTHNKITVKRMTFFHLDHLTYLGLESNIAKIESQAFAISKRSSEKLTIAFGLAINRYPINRYPINRYPINRYPINRYPINGDVFEPGSFGGLQRPVKILFFESVNYVPELSFKTILDHRNNNLIISYIDCEHCKNFWMIKDERDEQVISAKCYHNYSLTSFDSQVQYDLLRKCQTNFTLN